MKTKKTKNSRNFGFVRVGITSPKCKIADTQYNCEQIEAAFKDLYKQGCAVSISPEMGLCSYTIGDLIYQDILHVNILKNLSRLISSSVGRKMICVVGAPLRISGRIYNCAIIYTNGLILGVVPKTYLPNTGEYYEKRSFTSGRGIVGHELTLCGQKVSFGTDIIFCASDWPDFQIGVEICEDLWSVEPPSGQQSLAGATLLLNLSASNEVVGKSTYRKDLIKHQSARCLAAYAYVSSGPNESTTDMVFGGYGSVCENGIVLAEIERFKFDTSTICVDINIDTLINERTRSSSFMELIPPKMRRVYFETEVIKNPRVLVGRKISKYPFVASDSHSCEAHCEEVFAIQVSSLYKRIIHTNIENLIIGVSGGLDSTLALLVAEKTLQLLGKSSLSIKAITMPGFGTTTNTLQNAKKLCKALSIKIKEIDIKPAVLQHFKDIGHNENNFNIVYENCQARERTQILMDSANIENGIVLGTGDLSESALGWSTFNGDHMSMYNVNVGVPKTLVRYIINWYGKNSSNEYLSSILNDICETPISPELLPPGKDGKVLQKTEDHIGPYELHDFYLFYVVRHHFAPAKILYLAELAFGLEYSKKQHIHWLTIFYKRFFANQFKRSSMPDGPKVGSVSLSPRGDWRMPSDACAEEWLSDIKTILESQ